MTYEFLSIIISLSSWNYKLEPTYGHAFKNIICFLLMFSINSLQFITGLVHFYTYFIRSFQIFFYQMYHAHLICYLQKVSKMIVWGNVSKADISLEFLLSFCFVFILRVLISIDYCRPFWIPSGLVSSIAAVNCCMMTEITSIRESYPV
jgi:hypothetical protein